MSAFCHTPSPNDMATAKVKDPWQCTEEDWTLVSEAELDPVLSDDEGMAWLQKQDEEQREAEERRVCKEVAKKAQEEAKEACKVQEEAEKKEREEREVAVQKVWEAVEVQVDEEWRAREAAEAWADAEQRAVEERLWNVAAPPWVAKPSGRMSVAGPSASGQRASGVQDPCTRCCNKGTHCILSAAKGKTTVCEACHHMKVSCSWMRKTTGEAQKRKWVHRLEEVEDVEIVEVDEGDEDDEVQSHFVVPPHLVEDHWDALGVLTTTLDTLSTEFYEFWRDYWGFGMEVLKVMDTIAQELKRANDLKEEEMGKAKGKGKEKEEGPRR
ncbi:hypothetical protein ID866_12897, partial [Astraeus odoratus]